MSNKKAPYLNPFGTWVVTTEGDVEGRTVNHLGTFMGYIDEIALSLADKCYYGLKFEAIKPVTSFEPTGKSTVIALNIDSETWDMSSEKRVEFFRKLLQDRPVVVQEDGNFASVRISLSAKPAQEFSRRKALAKLTPEERELLGLSDKL